MGGRFAVQRRSRSRCNSAYSFCQVSFKDNHTAWQQRPSPIALRLAALASNPSILMTMSALATIEAVFCDWAIFPMTDDACVVLQGLPVLPCLIRYCRIRRVSLC